MQSQPGSSITIEAGGTPGGSPAAVGRRHRHGTRPQTPSPALPLSIPIPSSVWALLAGAVCTTSPGWGWLQAPGGGRCCFSSGYLSGQRLRRPPGSAPRSPGYLLPRSPAAALRLRGCCQQPAAAAGNPSGGSREATRPFLYLCVPPTTPVPISLPPLPELEARGPPGAGAARGVWWSMGVEKGGWEAFVGVG